ncbi:tetratricopeptide repeat-containing sulfotransferase family protein [Pedosphaera parvula]|uniref:Sulfotransferase n=1 Tax=Pedosphaera parvula (strain Ellin514) TaxID=320771 RepID=B9XK71_PEDPL|nr:sulfotransferase [Pedosphaera parvula]EEF59709.1 sulfotransferase [Pedosphaera parvula Ellin514]
MKRQQLISSGIIARIFHDAMEASRRQDYDHTIEILKRGNRLDPANSRILLDLGRVNLMRYQRAEAEGWFERAVRISPRRAETLLMAGNHCQHYGQLEMAQRYFARAAEEAEASTEVFVNLAELYERQRRPQESAQMLERALRSDPTSGRALIFRARMRRQAGQVEGSEQLLRTVSERPNLDPWVRAQAGYELGALYDSCGQYDHAMSALVQAKSLLRPGATGAMAALQSMYAEVNQMEQNASASTFQQWFEAQKELGPLQKVALLCGYPRSGTTLLEQVLDSHPSIVSAEETPVLHEEAFIRFYTNRPANASLFSILNAASVDRLQLARKNYFQNIQAFIGQNIGERLLIDKNPPLTLILPMIIRVLPEVKFLVALRDPRDVCLSCFMQPWPVNPISSAYLTFEDTVKDYAITMNVWRKVRPLMQNPAMEVRYEDMVENLEAEARRTLEFLGMGWDAKVLNFHEHAKAKTVRSPTYLDVAKPVYRRAMGRWRNYEKYFEPHLAKLEPFLRAFGYS